MPDALTERTVASVQDSAQLANNPLLAYAKQQIDIAGS